MVKLVHGRIEGDLIAGAVTGLFAIEGSPITPKLPPITVVCDYIAGWLTTVGITTAFRRRAIEGGSYRVVVYHSVAAFARHIRQKICAGTRRDIPLDRYQGYRTSGNVSHAGLIPQRSRSAGSLAKGMA
jgi:crotonobetainyl-CoA:carnitine CoA-transferase CaiB-like acyl-CoA transferase